MKCSAQPVMTGIWLFVQVTSGPSMLAVLLLCIGLAMAAGHGLQFALTNATGWM
jgi:hypothetical protein